MFVDGPMFVHVRPLGQPITVPNKGPHWFSVPQVDRTLGSSATILSVNSNNELALNKAPCPSGAPWDCLLTAPNYAIAEKSRPRHKKVFCSSR